MRWSQGQSTRLRFLGTGAVCSLIAVTFLIFSTRYSAEVAKYALKAPVKQSPLSFPPTCRNDSSWEFQVEKDGNDHGLSEEQCRAAFPKLFVELDKSASFRESNPIQFKDVDSMTVEDGMVRGIIDHGEVGSSQEFGQGKTHVLTSAFYGSSILLILATCLPPSRGGRRR